jgi:hypothetical protein
VPAPKVASTAPFVLTIAADGKSATIRFPNRDPIPTRILAMGGDSVVTEAGPYPSVLRPRKNRHCAARRRSLQGQHHDWNIRGTLLERRRGEGQDKGDAGEVVEPGANDLLVALGCYGPTGIAADIRYDLLVVE